MNLGQIILSRFRGREDYIAVQTPKGFAPEAGRITGQQLEREHLGGERCLGFYLLDPQSRCWCTCVDFDNKPDQPDPKWRETAERLTTFLTESHLNPLVEISQSGEGCHVWLFFREPTDAWVARAWWRAVELKLDMKFREAFPKQDLLTGKGMGNLVRYPLWNHSRFVSVESDWQNVDPVQAISEAVPTCAEDLGVIAFQLGMGALTAEPKVSVTPLDIGESKPGILPIRVHKLVDREWTLLGRRWRGDMSGLKDASRSACAMSIAVELVRLYVPTPEIASALRHWCRKMGSDKAERDDWVNRTVTKAYDFIVQRTEEKSATSATTFQTASLAYIDQLVGGKEHFLASGIQELDRSMDGLGAGEVCVVAARPGHGKSALAFQWLDEASGKGMPSLLISEEMSATQVGKRRLQSITDISSEHWGPECVEDLKRDVNKHHAGRAPVYVVENCNAVERAEQVIDQFVSLHGVGLVAVDYLQLLNAAKSDRYEVVTEISRRLSQCTKRNGIRMLLLCQLNREVEKRTDNEPRLSDLRESGQIEQDADLIIFAQWPCKFDANVPKHIYRLYGAKRRNGPIRSPRMEIRFDPDRQVFGGESAEDPFA